MKYFSFLALASSLFFVVLPVSAETVCCLCQFSGSPYMCIEGVVKNEAYSGCENILKGKAEGSCYSKEISEVECKLKQGGTGVCPSEPLTLPEALDKMAPSSTSDPVLEKTKLPFESVTPTLGVPIPGLIFGEARREGGYIRVPFLAQYIAAAYRYAVGIVAIAAIVMVVYGGFRYLIGSAAGDVKRGKVIIKDALIGMVIVLASYVLLFTVNRNTLSLDALKIPYVEPVEIDLADVWENPEAIPENAQAGITCTEAGVACKTGDECERLCNSGQRPSCSPFVADPSVVRPIPNGPGLDNSAGARALPSVVEALKRAGEIAQRTNARYRIEVKSGYRPFKRQLDIVCNDFIKKGRKGDVGSAVAFPGGSNHGSGRAVDIQLWEGTDMIVTSDFGSQCDRKYERGAKILANIMAQAGFVRYEKEIWHFELGTKNSNARCSGDACPARPSRCR